MSITFELIRVNMAKFKSQRRKLDILTQFSLIISIHFVAIVPACTSPKST